MSIREITNGHTSFYLCTQKIRDENGNVVDVECECLPDKTEAMVSCMKKAVKADDERRLQK